MCGRRDAVIRDEHANMFTFLNPAERGEYAGKVLACALVGLFI